ncbi:MAG: MBL fold metallo-hydrolase [Candidatus Auribacter fodinae]|uniref:MBL fold metallo-hydrolase n=1 Tax=Candidatus Auribacter fodinae TaxID=2093366 RepID=A0A3A4R3S4_9BACT|nr:MAG: MBL fold metallo-hydrolase [Candidatus Auribacter fodinae]
MRVTFLGTGTSYGIPMIGCDCEVCRSFSSYNKRLRSSILVSYNGRNVLIDTTPDLRYQMLRCGERHIDAVLFTHFHADHLFGLDDVRIFNHIQKSSIPCYGNAQTVDVIQRAFDYIFNPDTPKGGGLPKLELYEMNGHIDLFGEQVVPIEVLHGSVPILGFKWDNFAYITDCSDMPDQAVEVLRGIDTLVLNGLRYRPHSTHFSIEQACTLITERIKPKRAYLTHISHDVDHDNIQVTLPDNVSLAYDELVLDI